MPLHRSWGARLAALSVALAALAACSQDNATAATVRATGDIRFDPEEASVVAGGEVTWEFESVPHNVFFTGGPQPPADIPELTSDDSVSRTFTTVGTYPYECRVHPGMTGRVVVTEPSGSVY